MIPEFVDAIWAKFTGLFSWIPDYFFLTEWYALGLVILLACLLLARFFGTLPVIGGWIRALGGVVVLLYASFLVGLTVMFRYMRSKQKDKPVDPPKDDGGWFKW